MKLSTPQAPQAILSAVPGSIESSIGTRNYDDVSGNGLRFPRLALSVRCQNWGPGMSQAQTFYEAHPFYGGLIWSFVTEQIGQSLRKRYEVPKELPAKLLVLVRKLEAIESKSRTRTLIGTLDAIEGNYLKRCAPPADA